ncbi:MAG: hypothetical protein J7K95_02610 [Thermoplasmata archaeon]|nr:hypothetical protein [Thermoplasmata archaeon]
MNEEFWKWVIAYGFLPQQLLREIAFFETLSNIVDSIKIKNPFIIWKKVKTISPFVYSNGISFEVVKADKQTDEKGNFNVIVKITNGLEDRIHVSVLADLTPEPLINSLFPTARETRYNVGYAKADIAAGESVNLPIRCSFPSGGWTKKDYLIRVECGPSIQIGDTNQFGVYTYNIRWGMIIKPNYRVNDTVMEEIKNLWYNLPIFYSSSKDLFPTQYVTINYSGPTPQEELKTIVKNFSSNITRAALIFFSAIAILIVVSSLTLYFLIGRKYL